MNMVNALKQSGMNLGEAIKALRAGWRVTRAAWNGKGQYIELQVPDAHSKMTLPYVYIRTVQGDLVPWLCSQTDLLAEDWEMVHAGRPPVQSEPDYVHPAFSIESDDSRGAAGMHRAVGPWVSGEPQRLRERTEIDATRIVGPGCNAGAWRFVGPWRDCKSDAKIDAASFALMCVALNVPATVTINGRAHQLTLGSELTYERILELAGVRDDAWEGGPAPLGLTVTVKGRDGIGRTLTRGERVRVDPGLVVSAIETGDA